MTKSTEAAAHHADTAPAFHPLDPLSLEELRIATETVRRERGLAPQHRFPLTRLEEPTKTDIKGWERGADLKRLAFVLVLDRQTGEAFEALVDVRAGVIAGVKPLPVHVAPYGQPPVMIEEFERLRENREGRCGLAAGCDAAR